MANVDEEPYFQFLIWTPFKISNMLSLGPESTKIKPVGLLLLLLQNRDQKWEGIASHSPPAGGRV